MIFLLIGLLLSSASASDSPFWVGGNAIDWSTAYGNDIGTNDWNRIHQAGYPSAPKFDPSHWEKVFAALEKANCNFVRIPLMTAGQGILWDDWKNGRKDQIRGADPLWIKNVTTLLDLAEKHGLKVELGLITGNTEKAKDGEYNFYYGKNLIFQDPQTRRDYVEKVVKPLAAAVSKHPALFSIEASGEANLAMSAWGGPDKDDIRSLITESVHAIKEVAPGVRTTASLGGADLFVGPHDVEDLLGKTGVDYYEFHNYNDSGNIRNCEDWKTLSKPVFLGEFGPATEITPDPDGSRNLYRQKVVTEHYLSNAKRCGFMGAAAWAADPVPSMNTNSTRFLDLFNNQGEPKKDVFDALKKVMPEVPPIPNVSAMIPAEANCK